MKLFTFFSFLLSLSVISCRQSPKIPVDFDYGKTENGVYKNTYFDMEVPIPATWVVQSKEQMEQLTSEGNKIIAKNNKELASKIKASDVSSASLLTVFKNKTDSVTGEFNPSILIMAENLGRISGIKTGADYLDHVRQLLEQAKMGYQIARDYTSKKIGGKDFDVLKISKSYGETMDVKQLYHTIIEKGFALTMITSFATDQQEEELMDILHSIKFR